MARPIDRPLQPGELFAGRYRIEELIGRGGMGAVYRALDQSVGDPIALKTLSPPAGLTAEAVERFRREVRLARRITHPNVARVYDLDDHDGIAYLTMELVAGRDLATVLRDEGGPLPQERAAKMARGIAAGLDAAHAAGVVHRDLKPANVLVEPGGRVVITDFGIARSIDGGVTAATVGLVGTPLYMAPEQIRGAAVDARTDLYAFGLILFELLTGALPFDEPTPIAIALARLERAPPDPRTVREVPDALAELALRCLERDPDRRPSTAAEIVAALGTFLGEATPPPRSSMKLQAVVPSTPPGGPSIPAPNGRRIPALARGVRTVAVLPFTFRGAPTGDYLGQGISEELIDVLSRLRSLRVLASGATRACDPAGDPRAIGASLGAEIIVAGAVQASGQRLRISARMVDVATGRQLWSDKFDTTLEDVFDVQEKMARRIAEALRVSLATEGAHAHAPPEAIDALMRARRIMRTPDGRRQRLPEAIALLDECIAAAPDLLLAYAAHARACLWGWFLPNTPGGDWEAKARESVSRALELAPDLAETQLAAGVLAAQDARLSDAVRALDRAVDIAPTFADAHEYLGRIECLAGRGDAGIRRLRLAIELDPTIGLANADVARQMALRGEADTARRDIAALLRVVAPTHPYVVITRLRVASWIGDLDEVRAIEHLITTSGRIPTAWNLGAYARFVLGAPTADDDALLDSFPIEGPFLTNGFLMRTEELEMRTEMRAFAGRWDEAVRAIVHAAGYLADTEWVERLRVLAPIRDRAEVTGAMHRIRERARNVWGSVPG